jgi:hypothetical protein
MREPALMVLVGLLFTAGVYPLIGFLLHPADSDTGDITLAWLLPVEPACGILHRDRKPSGGSV